MEEGRQSRTRDGNTISNKRLPGLSKRVGALGQERRRQSFMWAVTIISVCVCTFVGFTDQAEINSVMNMKRLFFFLLLDICPQYFLFGLLIVQWFLQKLLMICVFRRLGLMGWVEHGAVISLSLFFSLVLCLFNKSGKSPNKTENYQTLRQNRLRKSLYITGGWKMESTLIYSPVLHVHAVL